MSVSLKVAAALLAVWGMIVPGIARAQAAPETLVQMLSGNGPDDAVPWDFRIDGGRRAGEATTIPVPSNWQQQGFGLYQYGYDKVRQPPARATYRRTFSVPAAWKGRAIRIVFDGVMTDALVRVNGTLAGPLHQGGFNRFSHDITALLKPDADNVVEVDVAESSAATDVDIAERHGDFWVFGGIYRPVWLEAKPAEAIRHIAVNGRADGTIRAVVDLQAPRTVTRLVGQVRDTAGRAVGAPFESAIIAGGQGSVALAGRIPAPRLWSAETPNLYRLDVTLFADDKAVHRVGTRFGFRTFEVREGNGLYLNGQRILLKGVNRASFRPRTGRALTRADAYADANTIKRLNMNAVRMSHYAPEEAFLEAADELGLYVIDELTGWQKAYATGTGRILVRELIERDVNHPSILMWANGNEGGWNRELDADFALFDPERRPVLHPWELFGGIDTKHYPRYPDLERRLAGKSLVLPTELLHALYDGGGGAGLDDYWRAITASPRGAGGFLWNLSDEGLARTDQNNRIDVFGSFAPDGLLDETGREEPSAQTVRTIWSPVQIDDPALGAGFDGALTVRNLHDFVTLDDVRFEWQWLAFPAKGGERVLAAGTVAPPAIAPHATGTLKLPASSAMASADALRLTATRGKTLLLGWTWPTARSAAPTAAAKRVGTPAATRAGDVIRLTAGPVTATIDARTGLLTALSRGTRTIGLEGGPQLKVARPKGTAEPRWIEAAAGANGIYTLPAATPTDVARIDLGLTEQDGWAGFTLEVSADGRAWRRAYASRRVARDGDTFLFPFQTVRHLRITNLAGVRATPRVRSVGVSSDPARFAVPTPPVAVTSGVRRDDATGRATAYVDAPGAGGLSTARWNLRDDGVLTLDYRYDLTGPALYHGIGFGMPLATVSRVGGVLRGPSPVWSNRMRGPLLGAHEIAGGQTGAAAATAGYFADPRRVSLTTPGGTLTIVNRGASFLQLGARLGDHPTTSVAFPASDIGFMNAIPAMGAKGQNADLTGPAAQPSVAAGPYAGQLEFGW